VQHVRTTPSPSTAAVGGHPLHPAIVPLPIGMLVAAAGTDVGYLLTGDRFWARASRWLLAGGIASGLTAALAGLTDFLTIPRARQRPEAWFHLGGNLAALTLAGVSLWRRLVDEDDHLVPAGLAATATIASILTVTGWLGGELAYRHQIGVVPPSDD
jgi:uncharacterized membrane protein